MSYVSKIRLYLAKDNIMHLLDGSGIPQENVKLYGVILEENTDGGDASLNVYIESDCDVPEDFTTQLKVCFEKRDQVKTIRIVNKKTINDRYIPEVINKVLEHAKPIKTLLEEGKQQYKILTNYQDKIDNSKISDILKNNLDPIIGFFTLEQKKILVELGNHYFRLIGTRPDAGVNLYSHLNEEQRKVVDYAEKWQIWNAAASNRIDILREIIQLNKEAINSKDPMYGNTALHMACFSGHASVVDFLLKNNANVNCRNKNNDTPLYCAFRKQYLEIFNQLLSCGANDIRCENFRRITTSPPPYTCFSYDDSTFDSISMRL